jgi:hypothetical protein
MVGFEPIKCLLFFSIEGDSVEGLETNFQSLEKELNFPLKVELECSSFDEHVHVYGEQTLFCSQN